MTRELVLILTAYERAVFSERAATVGVHRTLPHPTGAALLGWAAGDGRYGRFKNALRVFHSGHVRFSNALPLTSSGRVVYPVPQLLMAKKHGTKADDGPTLPFADLTTGRLRDERATDGRRIQREAMKDFFVSRTGEIFRPVSGSRLRTAIVDGHAAPGQLFGYSHLEADGTQRYVATIEADGIETSDWDELKAAFATGTTLRLGRASGTFYGGEYEVEAIGRSASDIWPSGGALTTDRVRVWVLSDLAIIDDFGAPCLAPNARMLGLPGTGRSGDGGLCGAESAISYRRYGPWNRWLARRDVERQVIAAGSVLTFGWDKPVAVPAQAAGAIGLWREAGLGRVWVAPPMLAGNAGSQPAGEKVHTVPVIAEQPDAAEPPAAAEDALVKWLQNVQPVEA